MPWQPHRISLAAAFAAALTVCNHARASGYPGIGFGGELGSVVSTNPTAIYYNPGALSGSGTQLMLDLTLAMRDSYWTHAQGPGDAPEPAGFEGANYGTAHSRIIAGGPQFAASLQLGKLCTLGGGWFIPWGGGSFHFDRAERFAQSQYPGAADGVARWHGYEAGMRFIYGAAGAAFRLGPLSIGATGNVILGWVTTKRALTSAGDNNLMREQRASIEASSIFGSFALGALLEARPEQLWIGVSYQAQPGLGELAMDGTYTLDATVNVADATRTQRLTMHQALPDVIRAGARFRPWRSFEMRLTGSFTRWSVNQTQCVSIRGLPCVVNPNGGAAAGSGVIRNLRRYWRDTLAIRGGLSYWPADMFEIFGGLGYEPAAVPDATLDPVAADADNLIASLGGRLRLAETWFVALSGNYQYYFPRDNTGKSALADPAIGPASRAVDGAGQYRAWFATANLNVAKIF